MRESEYRLPSSGVSARSCKLKEEYRDLSGLGSLSIIFLMTGLYLASTCSFKKLFFKATISVGFSVSSLKSRTYEPENQVLNVEWETWDLTPERILFQIFLPSIGLTILSNRIWGSFKLKCRLCCKVS